MIELIISKEQNFFVKIFIFETNVLKESLFVISKNISV
jgi:hypothetical protein